MSCIPIGWFVCRWNQLDIFIVILSIVGIVLEEMKTNVIPINPTIIRVMRVLRIARGKKPVVRQLYHLMIKLEQTHIREKRTFYIQHFKMYYISFKLLYFLYKFHYVTSNPVYSGSRFISHSLQQRTGSPVPWYRQICLNSLIASAVACLLQC